MEAIKSRIDVNSTEYQQNYHHMASLVADLQSEIQRSRTERPKDHLDRLQAAGKGSCRDRIDLLLDHNTPFLEIAPLAGRGMYDGKLHGAGIVAGIGVVSGKEVLIHAVDPSIIGGNIYPIAIRKTLRCQQIALENRLPVIYLVDALVPYLPLEFEVFPDVADGGRVYYNQAILSKLGIPQIAGVLGVCTAGDAFIPAMSDEVVHVKGTGAIFLGSPPVVKAVTGETVSAEELGGADMHCRKSGVSDYEAADEAEAMTMIRHIVKNLPVAEKTKVSMQVPAPPAYEPREIYGIVSRDLSRPYEVREVIARIVDKSEFLEFKSRYGQTLVCGWAYIHGYPVGILANNGVLFSECAEKAAQFIQVCDRRLTPLVFLQNISGFMVGKAYERGGITKHSQKMVNAVATAEVPKFTVMMGASYGAGNYGMCGRGYSPRFLWNWPNTEIGVISGKKAAEMLITTRNDHLADAGEPPMTRQETETIRNRIIEKAAREGSAYHSTAKVGDDGIIDPAKTRDVLGLSISAALNAPLRGSSPGYGIFRM
jgi:acetyl-CoA carboxylase carboxyltransferase component